MVQYETTQESPVIEFDYSAEVIELIVETVKKINFHQDNNFKNKLITALGGTITADCAA